MIKLIRKWLDEQKTYRQLSLIKRLVDARITYKDEGKNEWNYIMPLIKGIGDCQTFAETYRLDCEMAGYEAYRHMLKPKDSAWHAICVVYTKHGDYVLDCLSKTPYKA